MLREYATNAAISRTPRLSFGVVGAVFCPVRVKSLERASSQRAKRPCRHGRQRHDQRQAHRARACTQHVRHHELAQQAAPSPAAGRCVARGLSLRCACEQCAPAASFSLLAAGGDGRQTTSDRAQQRQGLCAHALAVGLCDVVVRSVRVVQALRPSARRHARGPRKQ